jgi:hypothetical protein
MTRTARLIGWGVSAVLLVTLAGACSSDDDSSSDPTSGSGGTTAEDQQFCTEVGNLIEQSSPGDLSALADLASFTQAVQSLAATAPEAIQAPVQTLATASQAKLTAVQEDPTATIPSELAQQARTANDELSTWVAANCGGLQLPTIDL